MMFFSCAENTCVHAPSFKKLQILFVVTGHCSTTIPGVQFSPRMIAVGTADRVLHRTLSASINVTFLAPDLLAEVRRSNPIFTRCLVVLLSQNGNNSLKIQEPLPEQVKMPKHPCSNFGTNAFLIMDKKEVILVVVCSTALWLKASQIYPSYFFVFHIFSSL